MLDIQRNSMKIKQIKQAALSNCEERAKLLDDMEPWVDVNRRKIDQNDKTFLRKFYTFPGDLTTYRIYNVLKKCGI